MNAGVIEGSTLSIRSTVAGAAFTALIAVGAYISIPIGPVPIVLQNFFVLLAGVLLGPRRGLVTVLLYLLLGAVGLPVFAGGTGGIAHFFGPTGGYLVGFIPAVLLCGFLGQRIDIHNRPAFLIAHVLALLAGSAAIYATGVPWLKFTTEMSWQKSLAVGFLPFIPGDLIKIAAAALAADSFSHRFSGFLSGNG